MKSICIKLILLALIFASCNLEKDNDEVIHEIVIEEVIEDEIAYDHIEDSIYISEEWAKLDYDSCVAYFCKDFNEYLYIVDIKSNELNNNVEILQSTKVNDIDSDSLINMFSKLSSKMETQECAFQPRHAFVFYKKNKIVAHSSICISCTKHMSKPKSGINYKLVEKILKNNGLPSTEYEVSVFYKQNKVVENYSH